MSEEIRCPKCGSNQFTTNEKGFSGGKAVAGAVLTGGIGLLAGFHGKGNIVITCLACGKKFKPGEGKIVVVPDKTQTVTTSENANTTDSDPLNQGIIEVFKLKGRLEAVKYCKEISGWDLRTSKDYVDKLIPFDNKGGGGGCFIATACYGSYEAGEVLVFREYRDEVLLKSFFGRAFVKFYYFTSPPLAKLISKSETLKAIVRKVFLSPFLKALRKN